MFWRRSEGKRDDELVSARSKVHRGSSAPHWDKTAFRVTKIPEELDEESLSEVIVSIFELDGIDEIKIHSLSFDAVNEEEFNYKIATVSFRVRPILLSPDLNEWEFELPDNNCRIYFDTHFSGFTPLSPCEGKERQNLDCIAIHGWGGHAFGSFRASKGSYMWLRDSLPKQFPRLRTWIYGYDSSLDDPNSIADVYEYAENFRRHLRILRKKLKANNVTTPIIYIVHSLGGWIFKEAMIRMKSSSDLDDRSNFCSTYGALFFGVPSQGMDVDALAAMVEKLPARYSLSLLDQRLGFRLRNRQHEEFCKAFDYPSSKIIQFFELKKSPTVQQDLESETWRRNGPPVLLVNPASATCGRHWERGDDYIISLPGDHSQISKFAENDRDGYEKVRDVLQGFMIDIDEVMQTRLMGETDQCSTRLDQVLELTQEEKDCLQSLYFPEMNLRKNEISDPANETCKWLPKHPMYLQWLNQQHGLLWVKGKPGAGKSTLMRHVVTVMEQQVKRDSLVVASFFFHGRGVPIQKSILGLFRSLLHQILQKIPKLRKAFNILYQGKCRTEGEIGKKWNWQERDLRDFFRTNVIDLSNTHSIRIYVDALDECGETTATNLVEFLSLVTTKFISTKNSVSICFSCRHYPLVALEDGLEVCVEGENRTDTQKYIKESVRKVIKDETIAKSIIDEVTQGSHNNFQWIVLVLPRVLSLYKRGRTPKGNALKKFVQAIPRELHNLYHNLIQQVDDETLAESLRLIQWLCFSSEPLTLVQLRFAMIIPADTLCKSIQAAQKSELYSETDEEMERRVRDLTKGLAEVRKESNYHEERRYVQFIHQSVSDYFIQNGLQMLDKGASEFESSIGRAHFQLSRSCIKYIAMEEIKQALYEQGTATFNDDLYTRFLFLKYAVNSWIVHARAAESQRESQKDLLRLFDRPPGDLLLIWSALHRMTNHWDYRLFLIFDELSQTNLLHVASKYNLPKVVDEVLTSNDAKLNFRDDEGLTALSHAVQSRHMAIMKILLGRNDIDVDCRDFIDRTPLFSAVINCDEAAIRLLLDRGAEVNSKDEHGDTPFSIAYQQGYKTVMQLLLDRGAEVNCKDENGRTPLLISMTNYCVFENAVVRLSLNRGAEVNCKDENGRVSLLRATRYHGCKEAVVRLLLDRGAEVNCKDEKGRSPLCWACKRRNKTVVRLLLDQGAEVNCRDKKGQTPLLRACDHTIAQLLLDLGAGINCRDYADRTPLHWAVLCGNEILAQLLLDRGAEVNCRDENGIMPLYWAIVRGRKIMVRLLILHGAEVNYKDVLGRKPLSWAHQCRYPDIVQVLLDAGAKADFEDESGSKE